MRIRVLTKPAQGSPNEVRQREPLTFGVPLPAGFTREATQWTFGAGDATSRPVQTRVLDRWADGSARWVLVDAQADVQTERETECYIDCGLGQAAAPDAGPAVTLTESGGAVTVDTGAATFCIMPGGAFPFDSVEVSRRQVLASASSGLKVRDASGQAASATIATVAVEERGPLRSLVRVTGSVQVDQDRSLELTARLHFYAGLSTVRLLITLTNPNASTHPGGFWDLGDQGSILMTEAALTFAPATSLSGQPVVRASPEIGTARATFDAPLEIYQDSSGGEHWKSSNHVNREHRVRTSFKGYRLTSGQANQTGTRATPIVTLERDGVRISVAVPHFWQNFPKSLEVSESTMTVGLFPRQFADLHELQGGEQKTHELFIGFGQDSVSSQQLEWCRSRTVASVDANWCLASGALPFVSPLNADHAALVNTAIDGPNRFELKRERIDEYGWRHFGEIYGDHESVRQLEPPIVSHYNNQYDPIAGFGCQFLRTGDTRWFAMMTELAAHVVDIDVYHTVRDKWTYNHGLFWHTYHYGDADTATHRTYPSAGRGRTHGGGPSADHNYTTGLMLHYFLTGDEASRRTVIDLAEFVINLDDGRKTVFRWLDTGDTGRSALSAPGYYGPGRGPANSLNALVDGYRLSGEERFRHKADQLVRRVIHPNDDIAERRLDVPELRWFYTMFLQSLGKYLHDLAERGDLAGTYAFARAGLLHYARWMAAHEYPLLDKPEKLEFPTETWAAQDIRKSDVFYFAALHASGQERASFIERGQFFHRYSVGALQQMATKALARPVVVLLTSGFMHSWFEGHPAAGEPPAPSEPDFGKPQVFVPQMARAKKRFVSLAVAGAIVACVGLALLLWR